MQPKKKIFFLNRFLIYHTQSYATSAQLLGRNLEDQTGNQGHKDFRWTTEEELMFIVQLLSAGHGPGSFSYSLI